MSSSAAVSSVADATRSVADAAELLRVSIDDPDGSIEYAVERLELLAATQLGALDQVVEQGFEAGDEQPDRPDGGHEDVLAGVLGQVGVGSTLIAASEATGEGAEPPDPTALDRAIDGLRATVVDLESSQREREHRSQGFAGRQRRSPDVPTAVSVLRGQAGTTLDSLVRDASGVVKDAYETAKGVAPAPLTSAIETVGRRLDLGERMGRLLRLGLRALRKGLDALARLIPAESLKSAQDLLERLWRKLDGREPASAALGWIFEVEAAKADVAEQLSRPGLEVDALDAASAALEALSSRFARNMKTAGGILTAIGIAAPVLTHLAVPQASPLVAGAVALVAAAIIMLGRDYADAGSVLRLVTGVRATVAKAVSPAVAP